MSDKHAVLRAVNADIFVLNSATKSTNTHVITQLQDLLASRLSNTTIVILTDPDVAGRQARNALNNTLDGSCWHAFIPTITATAQLAIGQKQAGDIGVEHASVEAIRWALERARKSSLGRLEFTREFIQSLGLVSSHDASSPAGDAAKRRFLVCSYMGLGECNGKQLLRQLNDYGFTKDDLAEALKWAEDRIATDQGG
jgi:ribonuclease M5